jgi:hypothetical protein
MLRLMESQQVGHGARRLRKRLGTTPGASEHREPMWDHVRGSALRLMRRNGLPWIRQRLTGRVRLGSTGLTLPFLVTVVRASRQAPVAGVRRLQSRPRALAGSLDRGKALGSAQRRSCRVHAPPLAAALAGSRSLSGTDLDDLATLFVASAGAGAAQAWALLR